MGSARVFVLIHIALSLWALSAAPRFSSAGAVDGDNSKIIHDACASAPFADLCVQTLTAAVEVNKTDLRGATPVAVALTAASKSGASNSAFVSSMLDRLDNPKVQQCFSDCSKTYIDAMAQVEDSMVALDSRDFGDLRLWVSAAIADTQTCRDGCKALNGSAVEELHRRNKEFTGLCRNVLALVAYVV